MALHISPTFSSAEFLRTHRYFFHHAETDIYVLQVFEKASLELLCCMLECILMRVRSQHSWGIRFYVRGRINGVKRALISVPALAHLSLDLTKFVPSIKRARSMLEVDEY